MKKRFIWVAFNLNRIQLLPDRNKNCGRSRIKSRAKVWQHATRFAWRSGYGGLNKVLIKVDVIG
jgi:hypothetical protein